MCEQNGEKEMKTKIIVIAITLAIVLLVGRTVWKNIAEDKMRLEKEQISEIGYRNLDYIHVLCIDRDRTDFTYGTDRIIVDGLDINEYGLIANIALYNEFHEGETLTVEQVLQEYEAFCNDVDGVYDGLNALTKFDSDYYFYCSYHGMQYQDDHSEYYYHMLDYSENHPTIKEQMQEIAENAAKRLHEELEGEKGAVSEDSNTTENEEVSSYAVDEILSELTIQDTSMEWPCKLGDLQDIMDIRYADSHAFGDSIYRPILCYAMYLDDKYVGMIYVIKNRRDISESAVVAMELSYALYDGVNFEFQGITKDSSYTDIVNSLGKPTAQDELGYRTARYYDVDQERLDTWGYYYTYDEIDFMFYDDDSIRSVMFFFSNQE